MNGERKSRASESPTTRLAFRSPHFDVPEPFATAFSLILLDARINDKAALLLLDVGIRRTTLFEAVVRRFSLEMEEERHTSVGIGGDNRVVTRAARLGSLRIGALRLDDRPIQIMVDNACFDIMRQRSDCRMDGVLGLDILRHFHILVDYPSRTVTLAYTDANGADPIEAEARTPDRDDALDFSTTYPYIVVAARVEITGAPCRAYLDSGSPFTMISPEVAAALPNERRPTESQEVPFMVAGGGALSNVPVVPELTLMLGERRATLGPVAVVDLQPVARALGSPVDVLLGCDVLHQYGLELDFPRRRLALYPHRRTASPDSRAGAQRSIRTEL